MTVILPSNTPNVARWRLEDYRSLQASTPPADAAGVATLELPQLAGDEMWLIDHAVVACTGASACEARLYLDSVNDGNLADGTARGTFDVADWPNGLRVGPSQVLVVQWTGATPGDVGTITAQYRTLRRS